MIIGDLECLILPRLSLSDDFMNEVHFLKQELVEQITKITHSHPSAVNGAIFQSYAVDQALRGPKEVNVGSFCDELQRRIREREESEVTR